MNSSNSPAKLVSQHFAKAKREWSDMSHTLLASYASGFVTPALCLPLTGNSTVFLNMDHALQTNPTVTPVFDSQRVNVRAFFYPQRLCTRGLYGNNFMELDEIENLEIPTVPLFSSDSDYAMNTFAILPGSLLNRLGMPSLMSSVSGSVVPLDVRRSFQLASGQLYNTSSSAALISSGFPDGYKVNVSPIIGYYDICAHYLANPYDPEIPMCTYEWLTTAETTDNAPSTLNTVPKISAGPNFAYNLYDLRDWLLTVKGIATRANDANHIYSQESYFTGIDHDEFAGPLGPLVAVLDRGDDAPPVNKVTYLSAINSLKNKSYQLGLFPSLYQDDNLTTYFDNDEIDTLMRVPLGDVSLQGGGVTVESYRLGKSLWNRVFRGILRGKKYDDWVEIQTGARLKMSDHPIFVGADYFNVTFNDVLNNSASRESGDASVNIPLGSSASRGSRGRGNKRQISFTAQEPGYLFVLIDIVPYCSYSNALPNWLDWKTFADFPLPAYAGRSFKDLKGGDVVFTDLAESNFGVVGKQPLYYDFMTSHDRLGGIFDTELLDTYTFKRTFNFDTLLGTSAVTPLEQIGSTYVQKGMYDYAFPDWGQNGGENYFIKTQFDLRVLQPIPRDVLKTRI